MARDTLCTLETSLSSGGALTASTALLIVSGTTEYHVIPNLPRRILPQKQKIIVENTMLLITSYFKVYSTQSTTVSSSFLTQTLCTYITQIYIFNCIYVALEMKEKIVSFLVKFIYFIV